MNKPTDPAPAPQPPVSATPYALRAMPAARLSGLALRWSADAALPTWQPGRLDLPSTVSVRFATPEAAR